MAKRQIIKINRKKCNGCGLCIPNCHEGAIQIINKKAVLMNDSFCDGLGACIGHCPFKAITIEKRDAAKYSKKKVMESTGKINLKQWPIQLNLVTPFAPYLQDADLLIAADCVAFAHADFHQDLLKDKILLIGCPKLDDTQAYQKKITEIFKINNIKTITCARMEVPCCFGLVRVIEQAIRESGKKVPFNEVVISIKGEKLEGGE